MISDIAGDADRGFVKLLMLLSVTTYSQCCLFLFFLWVIRRCTSVALGECNEESGHPCTVLAVLVSAKQSEIRGLWILRE